MISTYTLHLIYDMNFHVTALKIEFLGDHRIKFAKQLVHFSHQLLQKDNGNLLGWSDGQDDVHAEENVWWIIPVKELQREI